MQLNAYAIVLLLPALVSALLAYEAAKKRYAPRGRIFALSMLSIAVWSFTYAMELASTTQAMMQFWLKLEYLAIPWVSLLMLLVILNYAGIETTIRSSHVGYLAIIPSITMFLAITHEHHQLYYKSVELSRDGPIPLLRLEIGFWYYVHVIYSYLLNIYALAVLLKKLFQQRSLFRNQLALLLLAVFVPLFAFTLYFTGLMPIKNIDPTPFAFTVSGLLMSVSILRFRMLDLMPIAREHVFKSMGDGLLVIDKKMRLVDCNPMADRMFGWPKAPFGKAIDELWPGYDELLQLCHTPGEGLIELRLGSKEGERITLVSSSDILNHKKQVMGKLLIVHDITQRYKLQEAVRNSESQLRELNAQKDKLFSIIAHDLRSPISAFMNLTGLFVEDINDMSREEMKEIAVGMNRSAESLYGLLDNLLQWSRMQRNEVVIRPEMVEITGVVDRTLELNGEAVGRKRLDVKLHIPAGLKVFVDENMFFTILRNLVSNAIKFTPTGGSIQIRAFRNPDGYVSIEVTDTGIGMTQEMIDKLFVLDSKVNRPGTDGEPSTGLGLILCKDFAERNKGRLMVGSKPGEGSTFTLILPDGKPESIS
ncbi:MAG: PAS domain S-box protein [Bacteroidetes bacterium]|nr:PAS domain S-box protein [Bacteroidota bacterium]